MDESRDPQEFFTEQYAPMSDKELLDIAAEYDDLVDPAQAAVRDELKRRGLEMPKPPPAAANMYENRSNTELMEIARDYDTLPEASQEALRDEFTSRGLDPPLIEDEGESEPEVAYPEGQEPYLVTVGAYRDLTEALVARSVLQQAGIECSLKDENIVRMQWGMSNAVGGVRLQVTDKDAAKATDLLAQPIPASFATDAGGDFQQPTCPKCGSHDVVVDDTKRKIGLSGLFFGGLPLVAALPAMAMQRKDVWKCRTCGCRWYDDGQPEESATGADSAPLR